MLKKPEKVGNKRYIDKITRSPNQYPNCKTSIDVKLIDNYKGSVVIYDDIVGD